MLFRVGVGIGSFLLLAVIKLGGVLGLLSGPAFSATVMSEVADRYGLRGEGRATLEQCRKSMGGYTLKGDGDMATFCGCVARTGTDELNAGHKALAVTYVVDRLSYGGVSESSARRMFPENSYAGTLRGVMRSIDFAIRTCAEEARDATARRRHPSRG